MKLFVAGLITNRPSAMMDFWDRHTLKMEVDLAVGETPNGMMIIQASDNTWGPDGHE